ncbi:MAG: hypothetical protein CMH48_07845 [Muricauda sp.]|nr:hypothetical protein [Allomuricauda sp.]MBC30745.1 hypothetical protein [Allomuricauda sp.]|tara:strand:+ start:54955 stop:55239 length:285 start_codon:yes stop_codon:yes gene_type:complete
MKKYTIYRNIRKQALIFGLPVGFFALQMAGFICSLLVIIFSFSLMIVLGAILGNLLLYFGLLKLTQNPQFFSWQKAFPKSISNKQSTGLSYERD